MAVIVGLIFDGENWAQLMSVFNNAKYEFSLNWVCTMYIVQCTSKDLLTACETTLVVLSKTN